jgi:hypothetical protein
MATYLTLKAEVLALCESTGATDIDAIAKIALVRAVKYISRQADLRGLVQSGTYQWQSDDVAISITDPAGFNISNFDTPFFLLVGDADETQIPYHYMEPKDWLILKGIPGDARFGFDADIQDLRHQRAFTINFDNELEIDPVVDDQLVTLYYFKEPAAYADGTTPELPASWHDILVDTAVLLCRSFIEDPEEKKNWQELLRTMDEPIRKLKVHLEGTGYRRNQMRVHHSYNTRNFRRIRS